MIRILPSVGFEAVSSAHFPTHLPRLRHSSGDNRASLPIPNTRPLRHWIGREPAMVLIDGHRPADRRERWLRTEGRSQTLPPGANQNENIEAQNGISLCSKPHANQKTTRGGRGRG